MAFKRRAGTRRGGWSRCWPVLLAVAGCADPRISLDEFLAMQTRQPVDTEPPPASQASNPPVDQYLAPYRIGRRDLLDVTLTGLDEPTKSSVFRTRVDARGEIDLPLVGAVAVAGLEESEAEDVIQAAYVPNIVRQLTVNVAVVDFDTTQVVVRGAVTLPGMVSLRQTERDLLHAVLEAGGISSSASGSVTVQRLRHPNEQQTFNLYDPADLEKALALAPLKTGDIVIVGAAQPNTIFVGGLVNRPSPQAYPPGVKMTVLQVLAAAGGLREDVYPHEGTLIRRRSDGTDVQVKLDFPRIKRGQDPNITLAAGDVLWVPETTRTKILDFFNRNLFIRGGATITYNATGVEFLNNNAKGVAFNRGGGVGGLEDSFDPFGFLNRNAALGSLVNP